MKQFELGKIVTDLRKEILNWAFFFGIIYFIFGFVEFYIDADLKITKSINFSTSYLSI